jgi:hypothetical protein
LQIRQLEPSALGTRGLLHTWHWPKLPQLMQLVIGHCFTQLFALKRKPERHDEQVPLAEQVEQLPTEHTHAVPL